MRGVGENMRNYASRRLVKHAPISRQIITIKTIHF